MKAILVDDEHLPLMHLKKMLERDVGGIHIIGAFSDPLEAIEKARTLQPDVVFLDINMPEINGLEIGEQLQLSVPSAEIVFVTGYDKYAVDAFELCALDYIMKPVQLKRLQKTIERLQERVKSDSAEQKELPQLSIKCFNQIELQLPGHEPQVIKWRTAKARELFAYLLHHRNRMIDKDTLIELLWPDCDLSKGVTQLYTTVYLIRQTLKRNGFGAVTISRGNLDGGYCLTVESAMIDAEQWEHQVKQAGPPSLSTIEKHEHILSMYTGDYFGDYEYMWAEHERERLRRMWLNHARLVSSFYMEQGMIRPAIKVNQLVQRLHPLEEDSYIVLMQLYDSAGDAVAVEEQYRLLTTRWEMELDSSPNPKITDWYESWKHASMR